MLLFEDGPVVPIVPVFEPLPMPLKRALLDEPLLTDRLALNELLLLAMPLVAPPPVVLWLTRASPVYDD